MPRPINPDTRTKIIHAIKAGGRRNQIARDHGVSPSTVTLIAKQENLGSAFDRTNTVAATRAAGVDAAARRAALIDELYAKAARALERLEQPHTEPFGGAMGVEFVTTKLPTLRNMASGASAVSTLLNAAGRLEDRNGDSRVEQGRSLLTALFDGLASAHGDDYSAGR